MRDVDRFVDVLYEPALKKWQIPFLKTEWHRYAADLNRIPEDVDCTSVDGNPNPAGTHNRGFHWVVTTLNEPLMKKPMSQEMHKKLVELIYQDFHQSVRKQYENFHQKGFKEIFHMDAHSMPSVGTRMHRDPGQARADIVISDCQGKSCKKEFVNLATAAYEKAGFKVAYNWPYFGGRLSEQYGEPEKGHQVLQVEMNRALYMDEKSKKIKPEHAQIQQRLDQVLQFILQGLEKGL